MNKGKFNIYKTVAVLIFIIGLFLVYLFIIKPKIKEKISDNVVETIQDEVSDNSTLDELLTELENLDDILTDNKK